MILICRVFMKYMNTPTVQNVMSGLRPAVVGLIAAAALLLMTPENFSSPKISPWHFWVIKKTCHNEFDSVWLAHP